MTTPMTPSAPPDDDDQHWLDLMAGRAVPDARSATRQDAAWLRAALLAYRVDAPAGEPTRPDLRVQRLLQRAHVAGLLQAEPATGGAWQRLRQWLIGDGQPLRLGALAAALVLCVVGLQLLWQTTEPDPAAVERGAALQTLRVADPRAERDAMQAALRQAGLEATPYERLGRLGLDIELSAAPSAGQRQALQQLKLALPAGPALRVEFIDAKASP